MDSQHHPAPSPSDAVEIRVGFDLELRCPQPTPMIVTLGVHASRAADLLEPDTLQTTPEVPLRSYVDSFGNHCQRLLAPAGVLRLQATGLVADSGRPDPVLPELQQRPVDELPDEVIGHGNGRLLDADDISRGEQHVRASVGLGLHHADLDHDGLFPAGNLSNDMVRVGHQGRWTAGRTPRAARPAAAVRRSAPSLPQPPSFDCSGEDTLF